MPPPKSVYQIKVMLKDSKPPIWRRILVPDTITLYQLHTILQIVMGWMNCHLHMFIVNGQIYGDPEDDEYGDMGTKNDARYKLNQLVSRTGVRFRYEYDFGDSWLHDLVVEKILPAEKGVHYPVCIAGKRACPPEDVGGVWGYDDFLKAISDPKHPEHEDMMEWSGGGFDPGHFDIEQVNKVLSHRRESREDERDFYSSPQLDNHIVEKITIWSQGLSKDQLVWTESLAARRDMVTLLNYFKDKRPVGTQSTGNLQLKAVREVCTQFVSPPALDEKIGDKVYILQSEAHVWPLFFLHMLADTGGLVTGGQARIWKLTQAGETFLNFLAPVQLGIMLSIWWHLEDWRIAFPVSGLSQGLPRDFKKSSLVRLLELPKGKSTSFKVFADALIEETHMTWPSIDQAFVQDTMRSAVERMVVYPLVGFGVMENEYGTEDIGGHKFSRLSKICLTPFGKGLLETL